MKPLYYCWLPSFSLWSMWNYPWKFYFLNIVQILILNWYLPSVDAFTQITYFITGLSSVLFLLLNFLSWWLSTWTFSLTAHLLLFLKFKRSLLLLGTFHFL
jgi:hypothetical protein